MFTAQFFYTKQKPIAMAHIKFPAEFPLQVSLLNNIITKNNEDGDESPLAPWLEANGIDLDADAEAGTQAGAQEKERAKQEAASITNHRNRDNLFVPVFIFIRNGAQVLKKFYTTNHSVLREWGIPITDSGRIDYPSSFEERNAIAASFLEKLASFGEEKSPLAAYIKTNKADAAVLASDNGKAAAANIVATKAEKAAENARERRDMIWMKSLMHIHKIGDYLKSINPDNPRALGEWGFVVDEGGSGEERENNQVRNWRNKGNIEYSDWLNLNEPE
ncbi:MAG: hypothetical protein INR73_28135 [Williamsia sp.]|nr:hypothetical protein [Williamsia sp.]